MISVKKLLEGKQNNRILALAPDAMVIDALELMTKENVGAVMVVENEKLVGIFSERDYARKGIIMGRKAKSTPLTEVMTSNVFTVTPDMNMEDCMQLFSDKRIRHLPVVHEMCIRDSDAPILRRQSIYQNHLL